MSRRLALGRALWSYRWPLYLTGLLLLCVVAQGVLVFVATRPDVPRPAPSYYERSRQWDADGAVRAASAELGWTVRYELPQGPEYAPGMPRPVDLHITDRDTEPVTGLAGELVAVRPADRRLDDRGKLFSLPHAPGRYRTLVRLGAPGLWSFELEAQREALRFVDRQRVSLALDAPPEQGPR